MRRQKSTIEIVRDIKLKKKRRNFVAAEWWSFFCFFYSQMLDISYNRIRELNKQSFARYSGIRLLYMFENMIRTIEDGTFSDLTDLEVRITAFAAFNCMNFEKKNLFHSHRSLTSRQMHWHQYPWNCCKCRCYAIYTSTTTIWCICPVIWRNCRNRSRHHCKCSIWAVVDWKRFRIWAFYQNCSCWMCRITCWARWRHNNSRRFAVWSASKYRMPPICRHALVKRWKSISASDRLRWKRDWIVRRKEKVNSGFWIH